MACIAWWLGGQILCRYRRWKRYKYLKAIRYKRQQSARASILAILHKIDSVLSEVQDCVVIYESMTRKRLEIEPTSLAPAGKPFTGPQLGGDCGTFVGPWYGGSSTYLC